MGGLSRARRRARTTARAALAACLVGVTVLAMAEPGATAGITHVRTIGDTDYVSAGVSGVGSTGTGTITVSGVSGTVSKALLYWHGINTTSPGAVYGSAGITVNGAPVTGDSRGDAGNNCWGAGSSRTYVADITSLVTGDGAYALAGLASTPGDNANGASVVVLFDDGNAANNRDVVLFEGNDSNIPQGYPGDDDGWHASLPGIAFPASGSASLQLHVADGQDFGQPDDGDIDVTGPGGTVTIGDLPDVGRWDGTTLPDAGGSRAANGALYDIESFDVTPTLVSGDNTLSIDHTGVDDCLGLVVALVDIPVGSAPPPPVSCSIDDVAIAEGDAGTTSFTFTVSRTSGVGAASLAYETSDLDASHFSDYTATSGTVSFAEGVTSQPITVAVNGDTDIEGDEVFLVALSAPDGCSLLDPVGRGTILEDDAEPPVEGDCGVAGTNRVSAGDTAVFEGDSGAFRTARFPVTLTNASASEVVVDYTLVAGTATSREDTRTPLPSSGSLRFSPSPTSGVTSTTEFVTVAIKPDLATEADETLSLQLLGATGGYAVGRSVGTATILNDDGLVTGDVAVTGSTLCEGDSGRGSLALEVTLRNPAAASGVAVVTLTGGSASPGFDFRADAPMTVPFNAGQVQRSLKVTTFTDTDVEADEDLSATATSSDFTVLGGPASFVIRDDDGSGA